MENLRYINRQKLDTIIANDVELDIYDFWNIDFSEFKIKRMPKIHKVSRADVENPERIIYENYGDYIFEDIIYLINNIENPLNLRVGIELILPDVNDILEFLYEQNFEK
jgi:hypothetical protein